MNARDLVTGKTGPMSSVAFVGLGVMGAPMARHLAAAGHQVTVYNRTPEKSLAWVALYGNRAAPTPREAAEGAEFVLMCVGNDNDVREVVYGPDGVNISPSDPKNPLGSAWIGLTDRIGIHGAADPQSVGRDDNLGTICVGDRDLQDLYGILSIGSRVTIVRYLSARSKASVVRSIAS